MTKVSKSCVPCIHQFIPYMDSLFNALNDYASDEMLFPSIHLAAIKGELFYRSIMGRPTNLYSIELP